MEREADQQQKPNLFAEERRKAIVATLSNESRVFVNDLSERFGVSAATLRNDLKALEQRGLLRRTHGGAVAAEIPMVEHSADDTLTEHHAEKQAIGRAAAALVHDGDTIFCDSGSTTLELVRALGGKRGLTLVTNDFLIAMEAERVIPQSTVIALGGIVRAGFHYSMGSATINALAHLSASATFLAASAFSFERGFSVHTLDLALFKQAMIERSERHIMLMDSSKLNAFTTATFAYPADIDDLIIDDGIPEADRQRLAAVEDAPRITLVSA